MWDVGDTIVGRGRHSCGTWETQLWDVGDTIVGRGRHNCGTWETHLWDVGDMSKGRGRLKERGHIISMGLIEGLRGVQKERRSVIQRNPFPICISKVTVLILGVNHRINVYECFVRVICRTRSTFSLFTCTILTQNCSSARFLSRFRSDC